MSIDRNRFADLGRPRSIWAVGAVHGEAARLVAFHHFLEARFQPGDRLVYLGNVIGCGDAVRATVDELLAFRIDLLARPGMHAEDIVYLRGQQEEMWQKLLQLQFAPNPQEVLRWMFAQGVDRTLEAYGGTIEEGLAAAREGALQLTRWTNRLREAMRKAPGHPALFAALRRAAFTSPQHEEPDGVLLVSAGIDATRSLPAQGDRFWWGAPGFDEMTAPYGGYRLVVRGFDPAGRGVAVNAVTACLDGGSGRGGALCVAQITPHGELLDVLEI